MRAKGTIIKLAISIDLPSGLTMDDVDFQCRFFVFSASQVIEKSKMVRINENSYSCYVDTKIIGSGKSGWRLRLTFLTPTMKAEQE